MILEPIHPIRTESHGRLLLAGHHQRYTESTMGEIPELWHVFGPLIGTFPQMVGQLAFGVVWDSFTKGPYFEYMAAVEVSTTDGLPGGFETLDIPAQNYAVFEHVGPLSELCVTLDRISKTWQPTATIAEGAFPGFLEVYGEDFDPKISSGRIELWVALG